MPSPKPKREKIPAKLVKYLEKAGLPHKILEHRTVYSAIDVAATTKKKISEIAKSLLVKAGQEFYLVILPGDHNLDLDKLKKMISNINGQTIKKVVIPTETVIKNKLKTKPAKLSGFGGAHKVKVLMDKKLAKAKKAVFASGSANYSVEMAMRDFLGLEEPELASFGVKRKIKKAKATKKKRKK